jgi:hypothetical protein
MNKSAKDVLVGVLGAIAGVVASHIIAPAIIPSIELYVFEFTGLSIPPPEFLIMASPEEMANG